MQAASEQTKHQPHGIIGFVKSNTLKEPTRYDTTTGLNSDQSLEIASRIAGALHSRDNSLDRHALGLYCQAQLTLIMLPHNTPQQVMTDLYGISQPNASRIHRRIAPLLHEVLYMNRHQHDRSHRQRPGTTHRRNPRPNQEPASKRPSQSQLLRQAQGPMPEHPSRIHPRRRPHRCLHPYPWITT